MAELEEGAMMSLLSLSMAASEKDPIPMTEDSASQYPTSGTNSNGTEGGYTRPKTRRLSSASSTRRRVNDAREAVVRNSHAQNMAGLSNATAGLSLGPGSPPTGNEFGGVEVGKPAGSVMDSNNVVGVVTRSSTAVNNSGGGGLAQSLPASNPMAYHIPLKTNASPSLSNANIPVTTLFSTVSTANTTRVKLLPSGHQAYNGTLSVGALEEIPPPYATVMGSKKKGTIFRCESCSKVYRHPSCLIKHRWEHSPHWKEASRFLLSKHQQVQLLEAAAILSHITPSAARGEGGPATSLPEDRSLWPSYLANSVPVKYSSESPVPEDDVDGDINLEDDDYVVEDEEIDVVDDNEGEGDEFEMEMEFDTPTGNGRNSRIRDVGFLKGPISSSVPAGMGAFPRSLTHPTAVVGTNGNGGGHHRNRSRSRSISKSIHAHVIKTVRGHGRRASGRIGDRETGSLLNVGVASGNVNEVNKHTPSSVPADGLGRITTLRPGLIGVPTGSYRQQSGGIKEREIIPPLARSVGNALTSKNGPPSSWTSNALSGHTSTTPGQGQRYSSGSPAPINISHAHSHSHTRSYSQNGGMGYPSHSYTTSAASLSLPRSSVRSSSAFTETDGDGFELYDEMGSGGSGSEGKRVSPGYSAGLGMKGVKEEEAEAWDGMEMEMEM